MIRNYIDGTVKLFNGSKTLSIESIYRKLDVNSARPLTAQGLCSEQASGSNI